MHGWVSLFYLSQNKYVTSFHRKIKSACWYFHYIELIVYSFVLTESKSKNDCSSSNRHVQVYVVFFSDVESLVAIPQHWLSKLRWH